MLFNDKDAQALDAVGARKAADIVRSTDPDIKIGRDQVIRKIVLTAMLELDVSGFYIAISQIGGDAIHQTFYVLHVARQKPPTASAIARKAIDESIRTWVGLVVPGERILHVALTAVLAPSVWWRNRLVRRIQRRNTEWIRRGLITKVLDAGRTHTLTRMREDRVLFEIDEYDRLVRDIRLGYVA